MQCSLVVLGSFYYLMFIVLEPFFYILNRNSASVICTFQTELDTLSSTLRQLEHQKGAAQQRLDDLGNQVKQIIFLIYCDLYYKDRKPDIFSALFLIYLLTYFSRAP